jgi:hypothetical protein
LIELRTQHIEHIINGGVESFDEYRHLCGVIKGLTISEREFKEILSLIED